MRQSSLALLTLVLGLLVGAGLGYLLGTGGAVEASERGGGAPLALEPDAALNERSSRTSVDSELGEVGALPKLSVGSASEGNGGGLGSSELARAESAAASVLSRVSAASSEEESDWTGVITGTVVDEQGAPVAGATVVSNGAQSWYSAKLTARSTDSVGRAFPGIKALDEELEGYAEGRLKSRKKIRVAVTDAAGVFRLEQLEEGTHPLKGYLEGHVFESSNVDTGDVSQLIAKRVGAFELDIRLPDGTQPEEAFVMVQDNSQRETVAGNWTKDEPIIRFSESKVRIRILAGEPRKVDWREIAAEYSSSLMTLDLGKDGPGPHVVELDLETQLRVRVVDESSIVPRIEPWVNVRSMDGDGGKPVSLKRYRSGPFIATGLELGAHEITVGRGQSAPEVTMNIELGAGVNEEEVALGDIDLGRFIVARCTGPDGAPLTNIEFRYMATKKNGGSRSGGVKTIPRAPGEHLIDQSEFKGRDEQQEELKSLTLTAKNALMGHVTHEVDVSGSIVDFVFVEPGEVNVRVTGGLDDELYVALVPVKEEDDSDEMGWSRSPNQRSSAKVDKNGAAQVGIVQPGDYDLELTSDENQWGHSDVLANLRVRVAPGENQLSIVAPVLTDLVVHAPEVAVGATFALQLRDADGRHFSSGGNQNLDDQHRARFEGLKPGEYILHCWGEGRGQMEITVPCGEVLFVADKINGFEVTNVTEGKMAAKSGLLKGDVILGVNEHAADGSTFMNRLWVELAAGPSTLQVLRGGREVQVELEKMGSSANAWSAFGAGLTPRAVK